MAISFIRVDDRMIHGQTCTRWALEYPCDGLIAVNDAAAKNPVLKSAYKSASGKKTFVWGVEEFKEKTEKVLKSKDNYFLIFQKRKFHFKAGVHDIFQRLCLFLGDGLVVAQLRRSRTIVARSDDDGVDSAF